LGDDFEKWVLLRLKKGESRHDIPVAVRGHLLSTPHPTAVPGHVQFEVVAAGSTAECRINFIGPRELLDLLPPAIDLVEGPVTTVQLPCPALPAAPRAPIPARQVVVRLRARVPDSNPTREEAVGDARVDRTLNLKVSGAISQELRLPVHAVVRRVDGLNLEQVAR
jgi:hypothetical protein